MGSVLVTTDYSKFKFGTWNRDINEKNLRKIDKDVQKNGWKMHPIMVNDNMEVIDGQHRLTYAKQHHLPLYYVVIPGLSSQDCVIMNNTRTSWTIQDYVKLYASEGNENYIKLQNLFSQYTFSTIPQMVGIMKNKSSTSDLSALLKKGEYVVTDEELQNIKAKFDFLEEVSPYLKSVGGQAGSLILIASFCYDNENVNNSRLKKQIKTRWNTMTPPANREMALTEMEKIYNYHIGKENYVDITAEYKKFAREQMLKGAEFIKKTLKEKREAK